MRRAGCAVRAGCVVRMQAAHRQVRRTAAQPSPSRRVLPGGLGRSSGARPGPRAHLDRPRSGPPRPCAGAQRRDRAHDAKCRQRWGKCARAARDKGWSTYRTRAADSLAPGASHAVQRFGAGRRRDLHKFRTMWRGENRAGSKPRLPPDRLVTTNSARGDADKRDCENRHLHDPGGVRRRRSPEQSSWAAPTQATPMPKTLRRLATQPAHAI